MNTFLIAHPDLLDPIEFASERIVYPRDKSKHSLYVFYVKVTAMGGSQKFFGPFNLNVGCTSGTLQLTDNPGLVISQPLSVGDSTLSVYNFSAPISNLAWCVLEKVDVLDAAANLWTGPAKLIRSASCRGNPGCTTFDVNSTALPDYIQFKLRSTFTNNV